MFFNEGTLALFGGSVLGAICIRYVQRKWAEWKSRGSLSKDTPALPGTQIRLARVTVRTVEEMTPLELLYLLLAGWGLYSVAYVIALWIQYGFAIG